MPYIPSLPPGNESTGDLSALAAQGFELVLDGSNWVKISRDGYSVDAKIFATPSPFGISDGRVSKFYVVKDGKVVMNYDRGWDVKPKSAADKAFLGAVLAAVDGK